MRTIEKIKADLHIDATTEVLLSCAGAPDSEIEKSRNTQIKLINELIATQDAEISRLRQQCEWQPIETAPKDKRIIIAHLPLDGIADIWFGYWSHQHSSWATTQWHTYPADWITHWMPIPPLPQAQEEKEDNHE